MYNHQPSKGILNIVGVVSHMSSNVPGDSPSVAEKHTFKSSEKEL